MIKIVHNRIIVRHAFTIKRSSGSFLTRFKWNKDFYEDESDEKEMKE